MTEYEISKRNEMRNLELFFRETYDVIGQRNPAARIKFPFQDISAIFADVKAPVYVDWCHLGESGNDMVSKRMAIDVLALFPQSAGTDKRVDAPRRR